MIPIYQKGTHDCFRACVASVLNLEWLAVPDFYEGTTGQYLSENDRSAMDKWFIERDLCYFEMSWAMEPSDLLREIGAISPHLTYILMGNSLNGVGHAVVARGDQIIHDPAHAHPSTLSIARPCSDGYSRAGFISVHAPDKETNRARR